MVSNKKDKKSVEILKKSHILFTVGLIQKYLELSYGG